MRLARWSLRLCIAAAAACGTFGTAEPDPTPGPADSGGADAPSPHADAIAEGDASGACVDPCPAGTCKSWDFAGSSCPADLNVTGNAPDAGEVGVTCDGAMHVFAYATLDIGAELGAISPTTPYTFRAGATATVMFWQGENGASLPVIELYADAKRLASVKATTATTSGDVEYSLCAADGVACQSNVLTVPKGKTHRLSLEADTTQVRFFVDCKQVATVNAASVLAVTKRVMLHFGADNGANIDGVFDDVSIAFTRL